MFRDTTGWLSGYRNNCHTGMMGGWFESEFDPTGNRRPACSVDNCSNIACHGVPERTYEAADLLPLPLAPRLGPDLGVVNPRGYDSPDLRGGAWPASATSSPS